MVIKGYREVKYSELIDNLREQKEISNKDKVKIANSLGLKSTQTITNSLSYYEQKVSDIILSKVMEYLEVDGFLMWHNGKRYYYIKK